MPLAKRKPQTIDEYLATVKPDQRRTLASLRKTIHAVAPKDDLRGFQVTKGTIRFTPDNPMPVALVKKLIKARIRENRT